MGIWGFYSRVTGTLAWEQAGRYAHAPCHITSYRSGLLPRRCPPRRWCRRSTRCSWTVRTLVTVPASPCTWMATCWTTSQSCAAWRGCRRARCSELWKVGKLVAARGGPRVRSHSLRDPSPGVSVRLSTRGWDWCLSVLLRPSDPFIFHCMMHSLKTKSLHF